MMKRNVRSFISVLQMPKGAWPNIHSFAQMALSLTKNTSYVTGGSMLIVLRQQLLLSHEMPQLQPREVKSMLEMQKKA